MNALQAELQEKQKLKRIKDLEEQNEKQKNLTEKLNSDLEEARLLAKVKAAFDKNNQFF